LYYTVSVQNSQEAQFNKIYASKKEKCIQALKEAKSVNQDYLSKNDYEKLDILPCAGTISKVFGSWSKAKKAAGLPTRPARGDYTEEDCIESIKEAHKELGHSPSIREYDDMGYSPSRKVIKKLFGDWNTAIKSAGFNPNTSRQNNSKIKYTKDDCIIALKKAKKKLNKSPTLEEYQKLDIKPSYCVFRERFGSFNNAKKEIGMKCYNTKTNEYRNRHRIDYGPNWKSIRKEVFDKHNHECDLCGVSREQNYEMTGKDISIHHIIPFKNFKSHKEANKLSNLIPLCSSCHAHVERKNTIEQCRLLNINPIKLPSNF